MLCYNVWQSIQADVGLIKKDRWKCRPAVGTGLNCKLITKVRRTDPLQIVHISPCFNGKPLSSYGDISVCTRGPDQLYRLVSHAAGVAKNKTRVTQTDRWTNTGKPLGPTSIKSVSESLQDSLPEEHGWRLFMLALEECFWWAYKTVMTYTVSKHTVTAKSLHKEE